MLDNEFMMDFELWYRRVRNYNHNTAVKNLANLKRIVRLCVAKGWLQQDPFNTFKSSRREVSGLAPSEIEIARISNAEVGVGRLAYSKDFSLLRAHQINACGYPPV
jgi:predicted alpha/beta hydrolase